MKLFTDVSENVLSGDLTAVVFDADKEQPVGYYPHAQNVENLLDAIHVNFQMYELEPMYTFTSDMYSTLVASNDPTCFNNPSENKTFYKCACFWFDAMSNDTKNLFVESIKECMKYD